MSLNAPALESQSVAALCNTNIAVHGKNDIKISAEGVAKLTFGFLEELHGDSSLEPGEVKTPPQSPAGWKSVVTQELVLPTKPKVKSMASATTVAATAVDVPHKETMSKQVKTASQLDAAVCQEKVRAILELDAIKRKEEVEKRKEQMEKRRRSGEADEEETQKKKAKEERKRLKRLRREQEGARLALLSDEEDEVKLEKEVKQAKEQQSKSQEAVDDESEGLYSSSDTDSAKRNEELHNAQTAAAARYPPNLSAPQTHLPAPPYPSDTFMNFRGMNPFMRGQRPDFHNMRGGFVPRGRGGGMRGVMRFPGFRPPFYAAGPPRHHAPIIQRQHTPPPARGHSPIQAPGSSLKWTKTKPPISYAFNTIEDSTIDIKVTKKTENASMGMAGDKSSKVKKKSKHSKSKRKKSKKSREREKVKKRRSSRNSSEKSSKRKIEKIRKSMKRPLEKSKSFLEMLKTNEKLKQRKMASTTSPTTVNSKEQSDKYEVNAEEIQQVLENIKVEKVEEQNSLKAMTPPLSLKIKVEKIDPSIESKDTGLNVAQTAEVAKVVGDSNEAADSGDAFDMFAESPPRAQKLSVRDIDHMLHAARKASEFDDIQNPRHKGSSSSKALSDRREKDHSKLDTYGPVPPPAAVLKQQRSTTPALPDAQSPREKTSLQKAIEIQQRIDKLLQEDDLQLEHIQATKEKLLQKTKKLTKETSSSNKTAKEKRSSPAPEAAPPKHRNPFKRSMSRDRYFGRIDAKHRSRSRTRERDVKSGKNASNTEKTRRAADDAHSKSRRPGDETVHARSKSRQPREFEGVGRVRSKSRQSGSSASSLNRSRSFEREATSSTSSLHRSRSKDKNKEKSQRRLNQSQDEKQKRSKSPQRQRALSKDKSQSLDRKMQKSNTPPPPAQKKIKPGVAPAADSKRGQGRDNDNKATLKKSTNKKRKSQPLSFTAAEFLFPEADGEDYLVDAEVKMSPKIATDEPHKKHKSTAAAKSAKDISPDTDDYIDNWENDDAEVEGNSSTPIGKSKQTKESADRFATRFVNPSPPLTLLKQLVQQESAGEPASSTPQNSPPTPKMNSINAVKLSKNAVNRELFGMQEIYDQFIKSVEQSGVDIKAPSTIAEATADEPALLERSDGQLSTSTSTSSSSSSSSSSDGSNTSSSSSSSTASSSEESNDNDSFGKYKVSSSPKSTTMEQKIELAVDDEEQVLKASPKSTTLLDTPPSRVQATVAMTSTTPSPPAPAPPQAESASTAVGALKTPKSDAARDFKKLRSLEANLARIQIMRATYDSADEISEELIKMEKLFLQEKNLILQKYAKAAASKVAEACAGDDDNDNGGTTTPTTTSTNAADLPMTTNPGQFVQSLQETELESAAISVANRIFDSNREAIKLTISPLKLPKTPAIFEKDTEADKRSRHAAELEETDFTEKLLKPAKEIAIVKPMMESKDTRSGHQRQRRSPSGMSSSSRATRSPAGSAAGGGAAYRERDRNRRSTSRSRFSPQRRGRARSLSTSPPRRGNARHGSSPQRRGGAYNSRYRSSGRRSRSRSRSISKQSSRRGGELTSPMRRRRGTAAATGRKGAQARFMRDSRSRSPRCSPPPHHHSPRPHSPRSPPPASSARRRSYSRERYSRSPLPFKPPSPPMRRSLSPLGPTRRRSRSHSRSRSPPMRLPRSPRSPRSPPPAHYDDHRRRREDIYDRRSLSPQSHQYYTQDLNSVGGPPSMASSTSSYYYNVSPNRISLDARINIVLNGPHASQEGAGAAVSAYDAYSNYGQYGGAAYMSVPPHPNTHQGSMNPYYSNQYVPMSGGATPVMHSQQQQQQMYSNIPTISGSGSSAANNNFYYNEYGSHHAGVGVGPGPGSSLDHYQQSNSLLKELPKARVAVQKGNVLEIVPSDELPAADAASVNTIEPTKKKRLKTRVSWKEEVNKRQLRVEVLKMSRDNDDTSRSILKKLEPASEMVSREGSGSQSGKKKVYFEDGIFPNRDSEDEDRRDIELKIRRKVSKLRKKHGQRVSLPAGVLVTEKQRRAEGKENKLLAKLPPPQPPPCMPSVQVPQPIYRRPPTPTPLLYFHFDSVVHSMYISQLERPIPPRLLNPKCVNNGNGNGGAAQSPSHTQSPIGNKLHGGSASAAALGSKKELTTLAALNRSSRSSDANSHTVQKLMPTLHHQQHQHQQQQRRDSAAANALHMGAHHHIEHPPPPLPVHSNASASTVAAAMSRSSFHALPVAGGPHSPQMVAPHLPAAGARPTAPLGFAGMRLSNLTRLPPSPLTRTVLSTPPPSFANSQHHTIPVVGIRHNQPPPQHLYHMPPPPTGAAISGLPPPALSHEYAGAPPQHQHQQYAYGTSVPPPTHHHFHPASLQHRLPPPGYFMPPASMRNVSPLVEIPPVHTPPPTTHQAAVTTLPHASTSKEAAASTPPLNPQALVPPYMHRS